MTTVQRIPLYADRLEPNIDDVNIKAMNVENSNQSAIKEGVDQNVGKR
ncbi:MAG: hypothetical protein AAF098_13580 [Pseudomonadota bacterium]